MIPRSLLFVPGNRPERFDKACAAGADLVCIDLEDAVGPDDKAGARAAVADYLASAPDAVGVRVNGPTSDHHADDLAAVGTAAFISVPKTDSATDLDAAAETGRPLCPVIESARGLLNAATIFARPEVMLAIFGAVDFSADLDCALEWEALLHARSHLAVCAAAHGVTLFDVPYLDVRDPDGCAAEVRRLKGLGIHAKAAIHPAQIEPIHSALAPSPDEVAHAKRVVEASQAAAGNVALLDGKLIEAPLLRRAHRILERQ